MAALIITLTTDFGLGDSYVAQMKGAILSIHAGATIVDVTHLVPAHDVVQGGLVLDQAVEAFPEGTIHVAVIDPGVGGNRALLAVESAKYRFLAPDNGLLTQVLERHAPLRAFRLKNPAWWGPCISSTFHGRDILAPVAAHWSLGIDPASFGPLIDPALLVRRGAPVAREVDGTILGKVAHVDRFGNLVTNIGGSQLPAVDPRALLVSAGAVSVKGVCRHYDEQPPGGLLALIGSSGRLELAINCGDAAATLGIGAGASILVSVARDEAP